MLLSWALGLWAVDGSVALALWVDSQIRFSVDVMYSTSSLNILTTGTVSGINNSQAVM